MVNGDKEMKDVLKHMFEAYGIALSAWLAQPVLIQIYIILLLLKIISAKISYFKLSYKKIVFEVMFILIGQAASIWLKVPIAEMVAAYYSAKHLGECITFAKLCGVTVPPVIDYIAESLNDMGKKAS